MENIEDKNPGDYDGWTPLHCAALSGHLNVYELIMKTQVNKNPRNNR